MASAGMFSMRLFMRRAYFLREVSDQLGDVVGALAQRRHEKWKDAQPVIEIAAELRVRAIICARSRLVAATSRTSTLIVRVPPRRSNSCSCRARSSLGCSSSGISPTSSRNSVPLLASSKRPTFCAMAPVNAPFLVAEQLAFQQSGGNRRAVQLDEGPLAPAAQIVDRAGDQLLARAGLAQDQNRRIGRRHRRHLLQHALKGRALADDLAEILLGADFVFQIQLFFGQLILELRDFLKRGGIFNGDGGLAGHLAQKIDVRRMRRRSPACCRR